MIPGARSERSGGHPFITDLKNLWVRANSAMARTVPISAQPLPGSEAAGTITIEVAAKLLMVTPEWIRRLSKDGWVAKTERGRYRVVDVVQGYVPLSQGRSSPRDQDGVPYPAAEIRARKEELAVAQTERELVPLADAMTLVDEVEGDERCSALKVHSL